MNPTAKKEVTIMKHVVLATVIGGVALTLSACERAADVASRNLSQAADNFEINRRIVFYNGITDTYMLTIEGLCALGNNDKAREVTVTCKTGPGTFKKHFLGLSDNVTYVVEQVEASKVSTYRYRVMFRPASVLPDIDADLGGQK